MYLSMLQKASDLSTATSTLRGLLTGPMTYNPPTTGASTALNSALSPGASSSPLQPGCGLNLRESMLKPFIGEKMGGDRPTLGSMVQVDRILGPVAQTDRVTVPVVGEMGQELSDAALQLSDDMLFMLFNICQKQASAAVQ